MTTYLLSCAASFALPCLETMNCSVAYAVNLCAAAVAIYSYDMKEQF